MKNIISSVQIFFMVSLVLGLLVEHSLAVCAEDCYSSCYRGRGGDVNACIRRCIKDCLDPPVSASFDTLNQPQHFCNLGCVSSLCAKINTKEKIGEEKLGSCLKSCSKTCAKI